MAAAAAATDNREWRSGRVESVYVCVSQTEKDEFLKAPLWGGYLQRGSINKLPQKRAREREGRDGRCA